MGKYIAFFLDVDGTLLDSLGAKNMVFMQLLSEEGIPASFSERIILDSVAFTRVERFKKVWRSYYREEIPTIILEKLLELSEIRLLNREYVPLPGADLFLKTFASRLNLHIVSAANHIEIVQSFNRLGWNNYFMSINADLENKSMAFDKIMNEFAYPSNACLSVGDTQRDCNAAIESGIDYWRIESHPNEGVVPNNNFIGSSIDFFALINYLSRLN
jgi:phosphoglycolate phosphatase-like HAD superfamily hydrolase